MLVFTPLLLLLLPCILIRSSAAQTEPTKTLQVQGTKGKFFVHTLHSASIFDQTVNVKWSATARGRPTLPSWLHLLPSRHAPLAYLIGTPVTPLRQVHIHIIARRLDSFEQRHLFLIINLNDDSNYNRHTLQTVDLYVTNIEAESLVTDRNGLIGRIETAAKDTFRGKNVDPYVYSIEPEVQAPWEKLRLLGHRSVGSIVKIGTQRGFYSNIRNLVAGLRKNQAQCNRTSTIPIDKFFSPTFRVDWCRLSLTNLTLTKELADVELEKEFKRQEKQTLLLNAPPPNSSKGAKSEKGEKSPKKDYLIESAENEEELTASESGYSFWESVLLFPMIAVFCIILVLILSIIFFGRREGQQWRDYKTPRDQLREFVSVRESQRRLRELSLQRQLLLMSEPPSSDIPPAGIHAFLRPRDSTSTKPPSISVNPPGYSSRQASQIPGERTELLSGGSESPIGKQTVAEAARQCGSSLHLYRNPLESDEESEHEDSLEPKDV